MDIYTILAFASWWAFGFAIDACTHRAIHGDFKSNDWVGGAVMGCFGPIWGVVCYLALWSREINGSLGESPEEQEEREESLDK
jgi:hypothetical protein